MAVIGHVGAHRPTGPSMKTLSEQRLKAIGYRMRGLGKLDALKKAGYSTTYAENNSGQFWSHPSVAKEVNERRRQLVKKSKRSSAELIEVLWSYLEFDPAECVDAEGKMLPLRDIPLAYRKMLSVVGMKGGMKFTTADRLKTAEIIARLSGWNEDSVHITGEVDLKERLWEARRRVSEKPDAAESHKVDTVY